MGKHNSLETLECVSLLTVQVYRDIAQCYSVAHIEQERDVAVMLRRAQREGLSFFTKTLPKLGKAIDLALHNNGPLKFDQISFGRRGHTAIPRFIWWLLELVFDSETGYVRNDANITALKHARQLTLFAYKLDVPYDQETQNRVLDSFVQTEIELTRLTAGSSFAVDPIVKRAKTLLSRLLAGFDAREITPRHGPGAVATGEAVGEKSNFSRIYPKLEREYPFTGYFTVGAAHVADQLDWIQGLEVQERATAKVVLVPKDSRGPRIISCEPLELQWIQQGIQRKLYAHVESHRLTRGHVNFTDQSINRRLALEGSSTQKWVTLDMKDASDRVSLRLVERLFEGTTLLSALLACRSEATRLPDGRLVPLHKFAPMGSAVCFPIEAIVFWALAVCVLWLNGRSLRHCLQSVYVYGDDIILRDKDYHLVLQYFPLVGLKFNEAKCCTGGFFRESCGCDAYKGVEVTPVRLRTRWRHRNTPDPTELSSYVALSNAMWKAGYWGTAEIIEKMVVSRYGPLPYYDELDTKPMYQDVNWAELPFDRLYSLFLAKDVIQHIGPRSYLGFCRSHVNHHEVNRLSLKYRWNRHLHRLEFKSWVILPKMKVFKVDGWRELLRSLTSPGSGSPALKHISNRDVPDNVGVYALPRRSCLKRGWTVVG